MGSWWINGIRAHPSRPGLDELYIYKGKCLHKSAFTPPRIPLTTTLPGDYHFDSSSAGTGTDYSSQITITPSYAAEAVTWYATNAGPNPGYLTSLQFRGQGVYRYNPIEKSVENSTSITARGYKQISLNQNYQQDTSAGVTKATTVISNEATERTDLRSVTLIGNISHFNLQLFLSCDVGDVIRVQHTASGISANYWIQSVDFDISEGGIIRYTFGLRQSFV